MPSHAPLKLADYLDRTETFVAGLAHPGTGVACVAQGGHDGRPVDGAFAGQGMVAEVFTSRTCQATA